MTHIYTEQSRRWNSNVTCSGPAERCRCISGWCQSPGTASSIRPPAGEACLPGYLFCPFLPTRGTADQRSGREPQSLNAGSLPYCSTKVEVSGFCEPLLHGVRLATWNLPFPAFLPLWLQCRLGDGPPLALSWPLLCAHPPGKPCCCFQSLALFWIRPGNPERGNCCPGQCNLCTLFLHLTTVLRYSLP